MQRFHQHPHPDLHLLDAKSSISRVGQHLALDGETILREVEDVLGPP